MPANFSSVDTGFNIEPQLSFIPDEDSLNPLTPNNFPRNGSASFRASSSDSPPPPPNTRPRLLAVSLEKNEYRSNEILRVTSGEATDPDGFTDLAGIDFQIRLEDGSYVDIADTEFFQPVNSTTGSFTYEFALSNLNLTPGDRNLGLFARAYDRSGLYSNSYVELDFRIVNTAPEGLNFNIQSRQSDGVPLGGNSFLISDTLYLENTYLTEFDGIEDLERIDFWVDNMMDGSSIDVADVTEFRIDPNAQDPSYLTYDYALELSQLGLSRQPNTLLRLRGIAYDKAGNSSAEMFHHFDIVNLAPSVSNFYIQSRQSDGVPLGGHSFLISDTLYLENNYLTEFDGIEDIERIDFWVDNMMDGSSIDVADVTEFRIDPNVQDPSYLTYDYALELSQLGLSRQPNTLLRLRGIAYDKAGNSSAEMFHHFDIVNLAPSVSNFYIQSRQSDGVPLGGHSFLISDTLYLENTYLTEFDGIEDIERIDFWVDNMMDGSSIDVADVTEFRIDPNAQDPSYLTYDYALELSQLGLSRQPNTLLRLRGIAYDKAGNSSAEMFHHFDIVNLAPTNLGFALSKSEYSSSETLTLDFGHLVEYDRLADLDRIDFRLLHENGTIIDVSDVTDFFAEPTSLDSFSFNYNLDLGLLDLVEGNYFLEATAYDKAGNQSTPYQQNFILTVPQGNAPESLRFSLDKMTYIPTDSLAITNGWVEDRDGAIDIVRIELQLLGEAGNAIADLGNIIQLTPASWDENWAGFTETFNIGNYNLNEGIYSIAAIAYDNNNNASNTFERAFQIAPLNHAPGNFTFSLDKSSYTVGETLTLRNGWVFDGDGAEDIDNIELHLRKADGSIIEVPDAAGITPATWSSEWGSFSHSLVLDSLESGTYTLVGVARDRAGSTSNIMERSFTLTAPTTNTAPTHLHFSLDRTSYSAIETITLNNGWVSDGDGWQDIARIDLEIVDENGSVTALDNITDFIQPTWDWTREWAGFNYSFGLGSLGLASGQYRLRSRASDRSGESSNVFERSFLIV